MHRFALPLLVLLLAASGCASSAYDGQTAEQLYTKGMDRLDSHERGGWRSIRSWGLDLEETRGYFREVRKRYPASDFAPLATLRIADTYFLDEKYEEALPYYDEFIGGSASSPSASDELPKARERRELCAARAQTPEKMYAQGVARMEMYQRGIDWNPGDWKWGDHPWSHWSYDAEETRKIFQDIRAKFPVSREAPLSLLRIADTYFDDEMYTEALVYYEEFIKSHPAYREESAYAQLRRARCYREQILDADQDPAAAYSAREAFQTLQRDYAGSPESKDAGAELSRVNDDIAEQEAFVADFYYRRSLYGAAIGRYKGLIEQFPDHPLVGWSLFRLGLIAQELGDAKGARAYYRLVLEAPDARFRSPDSVKFVDAYILFLAYPNADATAEKIRRRTRIQLALLDLTGAGSGGQAPAESPAN